MTFGSTFRRFAPDPNAVRLAGEVGGLLAWAFLRMLIVAVFSVLTTLPWGLSVSGALALKFAVVGLIVHWALRGTAVLIPAVFASGLVIDALTGGPLGHWALVFTAAHGLAHMVGPVRGPLGGLMSWLWFAVIGAACAALSWGLGSAAQMTPGPWLSDVLAFSYAMATYPIGVMLIWLIEPRRRPEGPAGQRVEVD